MLSKSVHTSELDDFVKYCDSLGGPESSESKALISNFRLQFDTEVNENLDPFSEKYCQQQIKLYTEISGREFNQDEGEMTFIDIEKCVRGVNPYASEDISFISKHVKAITTTLQIANLASGSKILDVGSGWGLSSEIISFCGARVTCVDINPLFIELNKKRSARLGLPIIARQSDFDQYNDEEKYDLILFYESLHHALKPWETIDHFSKFVGQNGKFAFAGEPINKMFWRNWGLRLDPLSVYCIRKFGWLESGWSRKFIIKAFEKAGFHLNLFPGIGLNNGYVGVATRCSEEIDKTNLMGNLNPIWSLVSSKLIADHLSYSQLIFLRKLMNFRKL